MPHHCKSHHIRALRRHFRRIVPQHHYGNFHSHVEKKTFGQIKKVIHLGASSLENKES